MFTLPTVHHHIHKIITPAPILRLILFYIITHHFSFITFTISCYLFLSLFSLSYTLRSYGQWWSGHCSVSIWTMVRWPCSVSIWTMVGWPFLCLHMDNGGVAIALSPYGQWWSGHCSVSIAANSDCLSVLLPSSVKKRHENVNTERITGRISPPERMSVTLSQV